MGVVHVRVDNFISSHSCGFSLIGWILQNDLDHPYKTISNIWKEPEMGKQCWFVDCYHRNIRDTNMAFTQGGTLVSRVKIDLKWDVLRGNTSILHVGHSLQARMHQSTQSPHLDPSVSKPSPSCCLWYLYLKLTLQAISKQLTTSDHTTLSQTFLPPGLFQGNNALLCECDLRCNHGAKNRASTAMPESTPQKVIICHAKEPLSGWSGYFDSIVCYLYSL